MTDFTLSSSDEEPEEKPAPSIGVTGAAAETDYMRDGFRQFGLQEMQSARSFGYFLPLMHEMFNGTEAKSKLLFVILRSLMMDNRVRWTRGVLLTCQNTSRAVRSNSCGFPVVNFGITAY